MKNILKRIIIVVLLFCSFIVNVHAEDTINNIENLEKELEEKYKELDVIATKKVLHDRFYKLRFFGNRFDKRFTNTMLWFLIIFMSVNMPYMCVGEALPFNSTIKLLHLLVSLFGGLIGTSAYFIKKDRDMLKVFNNRNNLLGKDKFSKKPSKNEIEELCKIYKDYDKITLAIRNLEIKLQEQKAIKTVIEHNNQDKYYLNKNYSHANIPLMEFTSDDSSKTNDEDAPKMIVKK